MSAFYAVAYSDRVELVTDGAIYADDGTLIDIRRKVWTSPVLPLAVTGRGNSFLVDGITAMVEAHACGESVDLMLEQLAARLERFRGRDTEPFEIVLATISESDGPGVYYFSNVNMHGVFEPWTLYGPLPELGGGTPLSEIEQVGMARRHADDGTLLNVAVDLFEAMRRKAGSNPAKSDLPDVYGIGGHVDFTIVAADGCRVGRIHAWADVIGDKIDPFRLDAVAA